VNHYENLTHDTHIEHNVKSMYFTLTV